ncbi:sensory box histidine kinase/response regulator [Pedobacter sp. BAL39]|uniref:PAS domain S-box protein n=1 Tax=Pedobacter sp. BAL39 TaxID=391596 RepID=UPI00015595D5|nr:PAS domain S-box protein [Pedobacter sp. BAL39]EDM37677.1 sensory box histidine kinase/response regulator [Pedobacter sp. BAL39]
MSKFLDLYDSDEGLDCAAQLTACRQRIASILESYTDAFFEVDGSWMVTYWNREAEQLLSMPREEILGKNLWEVYKEAVPLKFFSEYHRALEEGITVRFEEYFDYNKLWFDVVAFPSGTGLSVCFKDITVRKKASQLLEDEREKYLDLFNLSPLPQWVYDLETLAFLQVNDAAVHHYGYSRQEFLQMTIKDIRPAAEVVMLDDIIANVRIGLYNQSVVKHQKKNGELILVSVEGNSVSFEGMNARLVLAIDQTERITTQQALEASISRYNVVSKATSDAIWDQDLKTGYTIWNRGISGIFGHKQVGHDYSWWEEHVHPDDIDQVRNQFRKLREEKSTRQVVEYRFRCADGTYKNVLDRSSIIFDADGVAIRTIGSMQDITERVNYIHKIEAQNKRLTEISRMQSHDVRAPLASILGLVSLLDEKETDMEEVRQLFKLIRESAQDLDEVIKGIVRRSS